MLFGFFLQLSDILVFLILVFQICFVNFNRRKITWSSNTYTITTDQPNSQTCNGITPIQNLLLNIFDTWKMWVHVLNWSIILNLDSEYNFFHNCNKFSLQYIYQGFPESRMGHTQAHIKVWGSIHDDIEWLVRPYKASKMTFGRSSGKLLVV